MHHGLLQLPFRKDSPNHRAIRSRRLNDYHLRSLACRNSSKGAFARSNVQDYIVFNIICLFCKILVRMISTKQLRENHAACIRVRGCREVVRTAIYSNYTISASYAFSEFMVFNKTLLGGIR